MGNFIDLTGNVYGKLTVIKRVENKNNSVYWLCKCTCGNSAIHQAGYLKKEKARSCGSCSDNTWVFKDNYVIGYTKKGEEFFIDLDDYKEVSKYTWYMIKEGYVKSGNVDGKNVRLHRFVMKAKKGEYVDHINHLAHDNRKSELRICSNQENCMNKKSAKGYSWDIYFKKYVAYIKFKGKRKTIGYFVTEDEARLAYCTKALELFGEFANESVIKDYERLSKKLNNFQDNT